MEELGEESSRYPWQDYDLGFGEELMRELLDDTTTAPSPTATAAAAGSADNSSSSNKGIGDEEEAEEGPAGRRPESMVNRLMSTVYSGPTLSDIESALSFTGAGAGDPLDGRSRYHYSPTSPVVFSPEKVLGKMENKYTMKIKSCGNGLADDGYKWRKYGQKAIKNSPNPRSYYRCTNPRCNAKKQVERVVDEPDTLVVTYEGLHLHYTYSHFLQHQTTPPPAAAAASSSKKPKLHPAAGAITDSHHHGSAAVTTTSPPSAAVVPAGAGDSSGDSGGNVTADAGFLLEHAVPNCSSYLFDGGLFSDAGEERRMTSDAGGLLEDMVPLMVRRPSCNSATTTASSSATVGSPGAPVSSPSPSTSSVSWTPASPYIDMAILSNIF